MESKNKGSETYRLDRLIAAQTKLSRKEAVRAIRGGHVQVDGIPVLRPEHKVYPEDCELFLNEKPILYRKKLYIMMNKPAGVLSASKDQKADTVISLLGADIPRRGVFPAGRLDKDTTGLLILTNDGDYAHNMLSPKKHVDKYYEARLRRQVTQEDIDRFREGIGFESFKYLPARLIPLERQDGFYAGVFIEEGKFHQVKRMFKATGNEVLELKRLRIGMLELDNHLLPGAYRHLKDTEVNMVFQKKPR